MCGEMPTARSSRRNRLRPELRSSTRTERTTSIPPPSVPLDSPVRPADVRAAARRIAPHIVRTPLTPSALLRETTGSDIWLKQENRQHTGSFKPRGALNKILSLSPAERSRGIVAASAGNHALGVAFASQVMGVNGVRIYVQRNAARAKIHKLSTYPVEVHLVGDTFEEAQQAALAHVRASGACYVSAYDDPAVIAGQGTCGLEIVEQVGDFDAVVAPVGGGALVSGIALAVKDANPAARVIGVNAAASPSALLSLRGGAAIDPYDHEPTLAHGLAGGFGRVPFTIARQLVDDIVLVSEDELKRAMMALIDAEQLLIEASGAAGLAAVLFGKVYARGKVVVVLSGGNIDVPTLRQILKDPEHPGHESS